MTTTIRHDEIETAAKAIWAADQTGEAPANPRYAAAWQAMDLSYGPESWEDIAADLAEAGA